MTELSTNFSARSQVSIKTSPEHAEARFLRNRLGNRVLLGRKDSNLRLADPESAHRIWTRQESTERTSLATDIGRRAGRS